MSLPIKRASQIPESRYKEVDFQGFSLQHETEYPDWMSWGRLLNFIHLRLESTIWNASLCVLTLLAIVILSMDFVSKEVVFRVPVSQVVDISFNVLYGTDAVAEMLNDCYLYHHEQQHHQFAKTHWLRYIIDLSTYLHYVTNYVTMLIPKLFLNMDVKYVVTMACYHVRLRRIGVYLVNLNTQYLEGGVITSCLKYWYIFVLIRVIFSNFFIWLGLVSEIKYKLLPSVMNNKRSIKFFHAFYILNKRFFPIGVDWPPESDLDRVATMIVAISGSLLISGISIAALALIISTSMKPEYMFRDRFRLIINDMQSTNIPTELSNKVLAFYKTYWHKQKAVSVTQLLPTYPPTLVNTLSTDIYFEALQKSQILRDLSYQFLSELAKYMKTVNYIPGDIIVHRNSNKYAIVYITYGDVQVVTAEDDETPILRFTRGSILNPCGVCMDVACCKDHVSVRAATFCTAHVLRAADLWRVAVKHGFSSQTYIIHSAMDDHLERVVHHYAQRPHPPVKHKSSVLQLKRNLIELKEALDANGNLVMGRTDYFLQIADCYIMRNQADVTDESDAICLRSTFPCILQPTSDLQIMWRLLVTAITLAVLFVHPYYLVFNMNDSPSELPNNFVFFNFMATVIYILDIIVYLSTGTNIEEGVPLSLLQTSSWQIRNMWFVSDVLAAAPIFDFIGNGELSGMNKLCKLPYVFRTLKILDEMLVFHSYTLQFFTFCLLLIVVIWLVAALNHGFLCFNLNFCRIYSFLDADVWEFNKTAKTDSEVQDILAYSVFWATSLTTITSHITSEGSMRHYPTQVQVMCILEVGVILHIVVQAVYAATIVVTGQLRNQYDACIDAAQRFLQKNNVDPELQYRFINYLQLCWYSDMAYGLTHERSSILFDLPYNMHQDISAMQRNKYLLCIPFMKELPEKMLKNICATAHIFYISPNEILLNTGDISNEIYVIKRGFCEVLNPDTKKVVSVITANSYFGDIECLMRLPAYYTVRAVTHVQVFSVSRKHLLKAIATKKIRDAILYMKDLPEYQELIKNRREQFLKYERPPQPGNKMTFRLPRKHENDEDFLKPFQHLGFFSMFRYIFPRFTIRPDGQYLRRHERFRAFFAMCSALIDPTFYLFDLQYSSIFYIAWLFDFTAYFDVLQRMLVGYYSEKGILVYHPASTFIHYFRGALIVDLVACLPLEYMEDLDVYLKYRTEHYEVVPKAMELLLFNRLLQLYRLPSALDFLDNYTKRRDVILCIKYLPILAVLIITVGSLISINSVTKFKFHKGGWKIRPRTGRFTSWILYNSTNVGYNITKTPFNFWLTTNYWATSQLTSTGFGIFLPNTKLLLLIFIVGMFIATLTSMYISVRMLSARSNVNQALAEYTDNVKDMIEFMKREKIPRHLRREVLSYYKYTWEKTGGTDYRSVFKLCNQITLRTDAILHIYGETFLKCPILHKCDTSLLRLLARAMHSVYFRRDTTIIRRDDINSDLYFVDYGTIQARSPEDNEIVDAFLPRGSMFGNLSNVVREVSTSSFVVQSNVHLLKIESFVFFNILKDFPAISARLAEYRPNKENFVVSNDAERYMEERSRNSAMKFLEYKGFMTHFYSHSAFMIIYIITVCLFCVFLDVYNAGFYDNRRFILYTLYSLDLAFVPKLITNLLFPFIAEKEIESRNALIEARKEYLQGEFKFDILSLLPLELFSLCFHKPFRVFGFFRLNRCLRLVTMQNYLRFTKTMTSDLKKPAIISLSILCALFIHSATCFWHFLGDYHDNRKPKSSWRWKKDKDTGVSSNVCFGNNYICSMYFIIITTMRNGGVHDILPRQHIEVIFVCMMMIFSTMMFMIYVGEFSRIIHYQSYRCFKFYEKYFELQEFLKNNRVSRSLVEQTKKYTMYLWRESRGLQFPNFVDTAPQCLRLNIMAAAYMKHLIRNPIFKHCEPAFLRHLVGHLKPLYYDGNMYVVREGQITNCMYFVHKGRVAEIAEDTEEKTKVILSGEYFGMMQGLYRDVAYTYSYKATIKSQVLTLSLDVWEYLLKHYTENKNIIYKNVQDPRTDDEFKPEKVTKVREFPPRTLISVEKELPKGTGSKTISGESKPGSDDISRSTQQLLQELKEKVRLTLRDLNYDVHLSTSTAKTEVKSLNTKGHIAQDKSPTELVEEELVFKFPFLKKDSLSTSSSQPRLQKMKLMLPPDNESEMMSNEKKPLDDISTKQRSSSKRRNENLSPIGKFVKSKESHSKPLESLPSGGIDKKEKKEIHISSSLVKEVKSPATNENTRKEDLPPSTTANAAMTGGLVTAGIGAILTNIKSSSLLPSTNTPTALSNMPESKSHSKTFEPLSPRSIQKKEKTESNILLHSLPSLIKGMKGDVLQSDKTPATAEVAKGTILNNSQSTTLISSTKPTTVADKDMLEWKLQSKSFGPLAYESIPEKDNKEYTKEIYQSSSLIIGTKTPASKITKPKVDVPNISPISPATVPGAVGSSAATTTAILTNIQSATLMPSTTRIASTDKYLPDSKHLEHLWLRNKPEEEKKEYNNLLHPSLSLIKDAKPPELIGNRLEENVSQIFITPVITAVADGLSAAVAGPNLTNIKSMDKDMTKLKPHFKSSESLSPGSMLEKEGKEYNILLDRSSSLIKGEKNLTTKENIPKSSTTPAIAALVGGLAVASTSALVTTQSMPLVRSTNTRIALTDTTMPRSNSVVNIPSKKETTYFEVPSDNIISRNEQDKIASQIKLQPDSKFNRDDSVSLDSKLNIHTSYVTKRPGLTQSLGQVHKTASVSENISTAPLHYNRRKSTVIGIVTDAIPKELESISSYQDESTQPLVIDLTETSSPSLLRNARKTKPSLEEVELARISYSKEDIDDKVETSEEVSSQEKIKKPASKEHTNK